MRRSPVSLFLAPKPLDLEPRESPGREVPGRRRQCLRQPRRSRELCKHFATRLGENKDKSDTPCALAHTAFVCVEGLRKEVRLSSSTGGGHFVVPNYTVTQNTGLT